MFLSDWLVASDLHNWKNNEIRFIAFDISKTFYADIHKCFLSWLLGLANVTIFYKEIWSYLIKWRLNHFFYLTNIISSSDTRCIHFYVILYSYTWHIWTQESLLTSTKKKKKMRGRYLFEICNTGQRDSEA